MKLIVPCCGRSSRYPSEMPKWLLPGQDRRPMVALALEGIECEPRDIVIAILREHEERFQLTRGLKEVFGADVTVVVHETQTRSQAETVATTIRKIRLAEPFLVKDSDNKFNLEKIDRDFNFVCTESLNHFDSINPRNKSYLQCDARGLVTNIREKVVISDRFCVGGYFFLNPSDFLAHYERLEGAGESLAREIYLSDVISSMVLGGTPFYSNPVSGYMDWGTVHEWRTYLRMNRAYLVALDGLVMNRGSEFFHPKFEEVSVRPKAIEALRRLADDGHAILYLSIRPERLRELTERQLREAEAPAGPVLFGVPSSSVTLLTARHGSPPLTTAEVREVNAEEDDLYAEMVGDR